MNWIKISASILLNLALILAGLYFGSSFFIPIAFGSFFALLFLPLANKLENLGIPRIFSTIISIFLLLVFSVFLILLLVSQVTSLIQDIVSLQTKFSNQMIYIKNLSKNDFLNLNNIIQYFKTSIFSTIKTALSSLTQVFMITTNSISGFIVVLTYTFLFLLYRDNLQHFIFSITPEKYHQNFKNIVSQITDIIPNYLVGVILIISIEIILNALGLYFIGVRQFLFWSMFVAFFFIIPFFGILIGSFIAVTYIFIFQGFTVAGLTALWFFCIQMLENNVLVPLIMKSQIKLNPLAIIMVVVLGGILWGIPGLILFMPLLGLAKVILANIPLFEPFADVIGNKK